MRKDNLGIMNIHGIPPPCLTKTLGETILGVEPATLQLRLVSPAPLQQELPTVPLISQNF